MLNTASLQLTLVTKFHHIQNNNVGIKNLVYHENDPGQKVAVENFHHMSQYESALPMDFLLALQYKWKVSTHYMPIQQLELFLGFKYSVDIFNSNTVCHFKIPKISNKILKGKKSIIENL